MGSVTAAAFSYRSHHFFSHEFETWSPTLREELTVFENLALRTVFEPKRNQMIGGWTNLINEELHKLYFSPNIIRQNDHVKEVEMYRICSMHEDEDYA
jgi:hypothetical protein